MSCSIEILRLLVPTELSLTNFHSSVQPEAHSFSDHLCMCPCVHSDCARSEYLSNYTCVVVLCPVSQKKLLKASSDCSKTVNRCWIEIKLKQSKPCHTDRFVALTKEGLRNCTSYVRLKRWKYLLFKCTFTYPYQPSQVSLVAHSDDDCSAKPKKHYQKVAANCKNCQNTSLL